MAAAGVPRSSVFLTTKIPGCGETVDHPLLPPCYGNSVAMAQADIEQLGGQVDLLLIHFPPLLGCGGAACTKIQQQWTAIEQLYRRNLTRAIGVSNFCEACLKCVLANATVPPMVNQVHHCVGPLDIPEHRHPAILLHAVCCRPHTLGLAPVRRH